MALEQIIFPNDAYLKLKLAEAEANGKYYQPMYHLGTLTCYKLRTKEDKKPCNCSGRNH